LSSNASPYLRIEERIMFHDILVAVDGSPEAEQALTQAIDLAEREHSRLTVITGVPTLSPIAFMGPSIVPVAQIDADARAWAEAVLSHARDRVPDDIPVTTILSDRPIRTALIEQINRGRHDLIVMGSRGRTAVRAALLGSVSHYILNHSPILVHPDPQSRPSVATERPPIAPAAPIAAPSSAR
jgi:nucleotide-binding universal stress UspA family protein